MRVCDINLEFSKDEIEIANKTSRASSAVGGKALVPKYVLEYLSSIDDGKSLKILDFGAGKTAIHAKYLKELGYCVDSHEFGGNFNKEIHTEFALEKEYDVIYASNVLNVQSSVGMLKTTVNQIFNCLKNNGVFFCNLPLSPRKFEKLDSDLLISILKSVFYNVEIIGGKNKAPVLVCFGKIH